MIAWLTACTGGDDPLGSPATCAVPADEPLRLRCTFPGDAGELAVVGPGVDHTFAGAGGVATAWDLPARTALDVVLTTGGREAWAGTLTTGAVPWDADLSFEVLVDGPSAIDRLVFPSSCGGPARAYLTDADGEIRWMQGTGLSSGFPGLALTDDGVAILAQRRIVRELRWDGTVGFDVERGDDVVLHHTLDAADGRVVVLDTRPRTWPDGETYLDDGVAELRGDELVEVFRLGDVIDPQGRTAYPPVYWGDTFDGAIDAFHLNAVDLLPDGGLLLSAKHLDALVSVGPDGALRWVLPGSSYSPDTGAHALTAVGDADASFGFQHGANVAPWGNVLLLDNGRDGVDASVLELAVDEVARTYRAVRRWPLGVRCPVQGSAYGLPDGSVVAACPQTRELFELDDTGVRRRVRLRCANGETPGFLVRALPVDSD